MARCASKSIARGFPLRSAFHGSTQKAFQARPRAAVELAQINKNDA